MSSTFAHFTHLPFVQSTTFLCIIFDKENGKMFKPGEISYHFAITEVLSQKRKSCIYMNKKIAAFSDMTVANTHIHTLTRENLLANCILWVCIFHVFLWAAVNCIPTHSHTVDEKLEGIDVLWILYFLTYCFERGSNVAKYRAAGFFVVVEQLRPFVSPTNTTKSKKKNPFDWCRQFTHSVL